MISRSQIEELRDKWRTTELNVAREHVQHVLLAGLYLGLRRQVHLAFKGGTALRLLYGSPRFSEDLDFSGWGKSYHVGRTLQQAVQEASKAGLEFTIDESAATSGGWFARTTTRVHDWTVGVEWNVSLRPKGRPATQPALVATPLWTAYTVQTLTPQATVSEKLAALRRRAKPRDFFDLYFILRQRLAVQEAARQKRALIELASAIDAKALARDLRPFLPQPQWSVAIQLPKLLIQELSRL